MAEWLETSFCIGEKTYSGFLRSVAGDADFDNTVKALCLAVKERKGLYVVGECGCGKTLLLRRIQRDYLYFLKDHRWSDCSDFDGRLWILDKEQNDDYRDEFSMAHFIDDFGVEVKTNYGRRSDFVGSFIRDYYERGTERLFISSNLTMDALVETYDARIIDRILDMCVVLKLNGKSKRERMIVK